MLFYTILCTFPKSCLSLGSWYKKRSCSYQELCRDYACLRRSTANSSNSELLCKRNLQKKIKKIKNENWGQNSQHLVWITFQSSDNSLVFLCPFQRTCLTCHNGIVSKPVVNPTVLKINDGKRFVKSTSEFSVLLAEKSRAETCLLSELSLRFSPFYNS